MVCVPRVLNRIHGMVLAGVNAKGGITKTLFEKAVRDKTYNLNHYKTFTHKFYDLIVFSKIRNIFGGKIRIMVTASAPIAAEVLTFFKLALGIHIYEAYGQTEMGQVCTMTLPQDSTAGHVGGCVPSGKIRLRDVPDMGYFSTDNPPRGEI
jgi:long-chain acyl-CoA synthetase